MRRGELLQDTSAGRCERQAHDPAVVSIDRTHHVPAALGPIDELDHAVVLQQQVVGQFGHRRRGIAVVPADGQQQLMLLRSESGSVGLLVAPVQEAPHRRAKPQQVTVLLIVEPVTRHTRTLPHAHTQRKPD